MTTNRDYVGDLFEQDYSASLPPSHSSSSDKKDKGEHTHSKYVVYVDESGDHRMQTIDTQFPVFLLAFCIFHKGHYSKKVVPALEQFKFKHFGHDQIVLHESEIRKE